MTAGEIADALRYVDPACSRSDWVRVLMAVKSALGDDGRALAEDWSAGADSYQRAAFRDTWRSIRDDGAVTAASLFRLARDAGWQSNAKPPPRRTERPQERAQEPPRTLAYARAIWGRVDRDDAYVAQHPYCQRKRIQHAAGAGRAHASGCILGQDADCIVVPLRTLAGELLGVECINAEGRKQTFGHKGVLILGNDLDPEAPILVIEGWASAVHALNAYRWSACAVVAGGKHRLQRVAQEVDAHYSRRRVIVCREVDANDH